MSHPAFRAKLDAAGHGVFVPVFFVATGLRFDAGALLASPEALVRVPLFLAALLIVRGLPAIALRGDGRRRDLVGAGLLQATLLPIAPTQIGLELGLLDPATAAALIAAGLIAAVVFPAVALHLLGGSLPATPEPVARPLAGRLPEVRA
jgi:Kef-type K+ transport system membrane component KefB